jgi:TRAP-type mannitol/chloroaromatic compound transport system permease small subunit
MGEEEKKEEAKPAKANRVDSLFEKLSGKVAERISTFVAFLFLLLTIGIIIGLSIGMYHPKYIYHAVAIPAVLGLVAYYNRDIAVVLFALFLVFFFFIA